MNVHLGRMPYIERMTELSASKGMPPMRKADCGTDAKAAAATVVKARVKPKIFHIFIAITSLYQWIAIIE